AIAYLRDKQTDITANIRVKSEQIRLKDVLAFNPGLAKSSDEELRGLKADLIISTTTEGLSDFALIPQGSLTINNLTAGLKNFADIKTLTGRFDVSQDTITVSEFQAKIGESDIRLSANLVNPRGLASKDTQVEMGLTFALDSSLMRVKDVFTYREKTYFLDSLIAESFHNLHLKGELRVNNQELFGEKTVPNFDLKINKVDWSLAAFPNPFEDLAVDISFQDKDLIIRNIQGRFGENDFAIDGFIENILSPIGEGDVSRGTTLHLRSHRLNLSDLDDLVVSSNSEKEEKTEISRDFPPLRLSLDIDSLKWSTISAENVTGDLVTHGISKLVLFSKDESVPMLTIDVNGSFKADSLKLPDLEVPKFSMEFNGKNRLYNINPSLETVFGTRGTGNIHLDFSRPVRAIRVQYEVENFHIGNLMRRFGEEPLMTGDMDFLIDLTAVGNDTAALNKSLAGKVALNGYELTLHGIDIDDILAKFKKSQQFNLVDLGAFMMAGPVGAVVTKGFSFAALLNLDPDAESSIPRFTSQWELKGGVAEASDVALVTLKSRVALKGGIDLAQKRFNEFTLAVVDKKGCVLVSQSLNGPFTEPEMSGISAVEALLAPIFNIFKVVAFGDCPRFYTGSLEHPTK
ncbi:MAG: AsmA family protein, partial [Candidatus Aminicenantes bacterium]|nr:AsmA family protein [Candidatus Aminicenantes bacterium]